MAANCRRCHSGSWPSVKKALRATSAVTADCRLPSRGIANCPYAVVGKVHVFVDGKLPSVADGRSDTPKFSPVFLTKIASRGIIRMTDQKRRDHGIPQSAAGQVAVDLGHGEPRLQKQWDAPSSHKVQTSLDVTHGTTYRKYWFNHFSATPIVQEHSQVNRQKEAGFCCRGLPQCSTRRGWSLRPKRAWGRGHRQGSDHITSTVPPSPSRRPRFGSPRIGRQSTYIPTYRSTKKGPL